jgi:Tfp pilus assembly protein PilO
MTMQNKITNIFNSIAFLLILIAVAGAIFYVKPLWSDVSSMEKGRDEKIEDRNELTNKLAVLKKLQQELGDSSEVKKEVTLLAIPEKLEQDKLIEDLSRIAIKNDMVLNGASFSVSKTSVKGEVAKATINTNLTGNEPNLVAFLKDLESNGRKMVVKNITIQIGETDIGLKRVNFNLNIETYYQGGSL